MCGGLNLTGTRRVISTDRGSHASGVPRRMGIIEPPGGVSQRLNRKLYTYSWRTERMHVGRGMDETKPAV